MSRYTGPKARISRRLGTNIFGTKGEVIALDKRPYPPGEHGRYSYKEAARQFPLLVPDSVDNPSYEHNVQAWEVLKQWDKPFLCAFSDKDHIFKGVENSFIKYVPGAKNLKHIEIKDAGHFLQEDKPDECVNAILTLF